MRDSISRALKDLRSKELFVILLQSVGLTLGLLLALGWGGNYAIGLIPNSNWDWVNSVVSVIAGLGLVLGLVLLFFPVAALFIGLFLEPIADAVEARNYPNDPEAPGLAIVPGLIAAMKFLLVLILANIALIPTYFLGIGFILVFLVNAHLIGREYFELVALRHLKPKDARVLRKDHRWRIFQAGAIIALALSIPLVNLAAPLFGVAMMVHIFKGIGRP